MVRSFLPTPIDSAVTERILSNAVRAPSAGFSQGWGFLVLETDDDRARFWEALGGVATGKDFQWPGLVNAPLIVVPMSNEDVYLDRYAQPDKGWTDRDPNRWPVPFWHIDTGMASLLMLLTAVDENLGALFFGITPDRIASFRAAFNVPDDFTPVGAIAIGHPAPDDRPSGSLKRGHRDMSDVVRRGMWTVR